MIFDMTTVQVQFFDSTETTIIAYFASAQSPSAFQNLGTVDTSDARWKAYYTLLSEAGYAEAVPAPG